LYGYQNISLNCRNVNSKFARSFYQLIQDLFEENNAVPVLTTPSVSRTTDKTYHYLRISTEPGCV